MADQMAEISARFSTHLAFVMLDLRRNQ